MVTEIMHWEGENYRQHESKGLIVKIILCADYIEPYLHTKFEVQVTTVIGFSFFNRKENNNKKKNTDN